MNHFTTAMPTMVSRSEYIDPVARHIRSVYEEFTSRWAREQQRRQDEPNRERIVITSSSSSPAISEAETEKRVNANSSNEQTTSSPAQASVQRDVEVPVVVAQHQRRSTSIDRSDQDGSTVFPTRQGRRPSNQHNNHLKSHTTSQATPRKEPYLKPAYEQDHEHEHEHRHDHEHHVEFTLAMGKGSRTSARLHQPPSPTLFRDDRNVSKTRSVRLRDRQNKPHDSTRNTRQSQRIENGAYDMDDQPTERQRRYAQRQEQRSGGSTSVKAMLQHSESDEDVVDSKRRRPRSNTAHAAKRLRRSSEDNKSKLSAKEAEAEREARLKHKLEREAEERSIVERYAADLRANEVEVRKCYYCWHYSQPCNLKLKPKCIPCHKNRRSCFGGYTRREFCQAYEGRTGKVHKLTKKDIIKHRPQMKRKGHYNRPRNSGSATTPQPQRFFLNPNQLKCYRCWDRNLSCDLNTPKCGSCEKSRSACFGFKSNREEFCEMFEEETGVKHRWAAFFDGEEPQPTPRPSGASSRRKSRVTAYEDETPEASEEDGWDSEDDDSEEDDIDDTEDEE